MPEQERSQPMPLAGVRVLDLGRHQAGPTCAMWLGDLGADVIKIENPDRGEDGRASGPPFFHGESAFFLSANRNKRSLALDIKRPEGQEIFRRLAAEADVVIENFRPGVMDALNIGYARVSALNPRIIYCSISGFGADGPYADRPGLDQIIQGVSGLMSVTGFEGGEPVRVGIPIADLVTGLFGAYGVLAALQARERTGRGQHIQTSLLECMVGLMSFQAVRYLNGAGTPPPAGNHHPINAPYGVFRAKDGYLTLGATGEKRWRKLCEILGTEEWLTDPRFATNGARHENRLLLADLISEKLQARTADEWERIFNEAGIPCGPIYRVDQALEHPQVRHREMVVERAHPTMGTVRLLGVPVKFSETPAGLHRVPPLFAEHTDEILREIGISDDEIERLREAGIVRSGPATPGTEEP
ncbi:CaiB/BaiF CoA transferase family protein [Sphaerobacter thermophilus]|uniref:Formyl-CoA transferase n=1 Tax=Sphaerobacter thermophilus (strain ATCC 49802 / DSM 20745 / KCCM 41009 / NCIMB 13125 / S 6022) TaxID=479434 RepID=D1C9A9_SPHTD|nr:CoA transferase [Sphaerobacter thermophilus]ACZ40402.1 Formyl-CoA transferase [Sphaerobacter thermophilus DSM 20745]